MPVGYRAVAEAYRRAATSIEVADLTDHYGDGLEGFHSRFVPRVKRLIERLTDGAWDLTEHVAFAAGSDVDFMTHLVDAIASKERVALYPDDWWGFRVGSVHGENIAWDACGDAALACLCIPSVRNGHVTDGMRAFLNGAPANLWNLNLFPTLRPEERHGVAASLAPLLDRAVLSISFSRGFGMTASQLGLALVPKGHPYVARFETQWRWLTYFHNALAARAFLEVDLDALARVDAERRAWVARELERRGLPAIDTGTYYVRAFRAEGELAPHLAPLSRGNVVRLCFKPPQV